MSKLDEMQAALAPAKKDGYTVTQTLYDSLEAALTTAKTQIEDLQLRIRELEAELITARRTINEYAGYFATEREVLLAEQALSDKLEKALAEAVDEIEGMSGQDMSCDPNIYCDDFRALLEEVAAIRAKQE